MFRIKTQSRYEVASVSSFIPSNWWLYDKGILTMRKFLISLVISTILVTPAFAAENILKEGHPDQYTVKEGDTLWGIASMFLADAWLWPEIWQVNPEVENPHLIFPGDVLTLSYLEGEPRLTLKRGDQARTVKLSPRGSEQRRDNKTTRLQPKVRVSQITSSIPAIPLDSISSMLTKGRIVDEGTLENAPYILAGRDDRLIFGPGDEFYGRGKNWDSVTTVFGIYREGNRYVDPETKEILGYEAIEVGLARVRERDGDMISFSLVSVKEDVRIGDRLLPTEEIKVESTFYPAPPKEKVNGLIMTVVGGVTQIGRNDVVVINRGTRQGIDTGLVLAVNKTGKIVRDRFAKEGFLPEKVQLPAERAGLLMVFRAFEKMSYALILSTTEPLRVGDSVTNP